MFTIRHASKTEKASTPGSELFGDKVRYRLNRFLLFSLVQFTHHHRVARDKDKVAGDVLSDDSRSHTQNTHILPSVLFC